MNSYEECIYNLTNDEETYDLNTSMTDEAISDTEGYRNRRNRLLDYSDRYDGLINLTISAEEADAVAPINEVEVEELPGEEIEDKEEEGAMCSSRPTHRKHMSMAGIEIQKLESLKPKTRAMSQTIDFEDNKDMMFSSVKYLYDQNTDRSRKRVQQMRKMQISRGSSCPNIDTDELKVKMGKKYNEDNSDANDFINNCQNKKNCERVNNTYSNQVQSEGENVMTTIHSTNHTDTMTKPSLDTNTYNNNDTEVNISDLDCSLNKSAKNIEEPVGTTSYSQYTQKSFIPITNSLKIKKDAKEENSTPSYLLALNIDTNNQESVEESEIDERNTNENMDSLDFDNTKIKSLSKSSKDVRHVRLPSGKNFMINSVIEEEYSEMCSDSELSFKKQSFLFTKAKLDSSSGKKVSFNSSQEMNIEKNLESLYFNKMKSSHLQSKSEITTELNSNVKLEIKKTGPGDQNYAKNELFHIQIDLKKNFDELKKKVLEEEEKSKSKVESKKREIIDMFFNKGKVNEPMKKIVLNLQPIDTYNIPNSPKYICKKSPSSFTRDEYYNSSGNKSAEKQELEVVRKSPLKKDVPEEPVTIIMNKISNPANDTKSLRELYKRERGKSRKSSIFKSDELRISKGENMIFNTNKRENTYNSIAEQFSMININICTPSTLRNEVNENSKSSEKVDKTITTTFDIIKNNISNNDLCQASPIINNVKYLNFNLTISNQKEEEDKDDISSQTIRKKLFNDSVIEIKHEEELAISNEIKFDIIINKKPEVKKVDDYAKKDVMRSSMCDIFKKESKFQHKKHISMMPNKSNFSNHESKITKLASEVTNCNLLSGEGKIHTALYDYSNMKRFVSIEPPVTHEKYENNFNRILEKKTSFLKKESEQPKYNGVLNKKSRSSSDSSVKYTNKDNLLSRPSPTAHNYIFNNYNLNNKKIAKKIFNTPSNVSEKVTNPNGRNFSHDLRTDIKIIKDLGKTSDLKNIIFSKNIKTLTSTLKSNLDKFTHLMNKNNIHNIPKVPSKKPISSYRNISDIPVHDFNIEKNHFYEKLKHLNKIDKNSLSKTDIKCSWK